MPFRILATARSFAKSDGPHHEYLRQHDCLIDNRAGEHPYKAAELATIIPGYEGAILGLDECDASVIAKADKLRVISRYGVGVDQVDLRAAAEHGIAVTNTPGANKIAVAELAIGLLFSLARNIPAVAAAAKAGAWKRTPGWELTGKTLGVVGFGEIGREVAARARALGMSVMVFDPYFRGEIHGVQQVDLYTLLECCHAVTLHCALTPETQHLINTDRIARMRHGAYLINTARGGLVDEVALHEALVSGQLAGAAADVFQEDPPTGSPLLALDNFIPTPHLGATTKESVQRMSMMAAENLVAVLKGEPCPFVVNAALLAARQAPADRE